MFVAEKEAPPSSLKASSSTTATTTPSQLPPDNNKSTEQAANNETSSKNAEGKNDDEGDSMVTTCSCQKYYQGPHNVYHTNKGEYFKKKLLRRKLSAKGRRELEDRLSELFYYLRTN